MRNLLDRLAAKALLGVGRNVVLGGVEALGPTHAYTAYVDVRGWALGLDGVSQIEVQFLLDERLVGSVSPALERPDVQQRFPRVAGSGRCGFETRLTMDVLPWEGSCALTVRAVSSTPRSGRSILARVRLTRQTSAPARANYGAVWDDVSGDLVNARVAVAGYEDVAEFDRSGTSTAEDIVALAGVTPDDTVVEIGCGTGRVGVKLAPKCRRWIGCDVSTNMLAHAKQALRECSNVGFVRLNGFDLAGVETGSADVVYCTGVFMHLDEWDRFRYVVEAHRVLKVGGRVYFDNFDLTSPEGWQVFMNAYVVEPAARPANIGKSSTAAELQTYADRAGFTDVAVLRRGVWVTVVATRSARDGSQGG